VASVSVGERALPVAEIGPPNPLPAFADTRTFASELPKDRFPHDIATNIDYGLPPSIHPYLLQDGYGRRRRPGSIRTAVLQNSNLRAEFALGLGGRLWSLRSLPSGRELVYANSVLQPANLALRNAWFAGGVEWNIGTRGHSPTTCSPLHAAVVPSPGADGGEALRMWEWERLRGVVFQIDAWLPESSPVLLVHVRIRNPRDEVVPMYWWSNTAVTERPDLRVLTPAERAFHIGYDGGLDVPATAGASWSYPASCPQAADYFYDMPPGRRPWIAALYGDDGQGLVQTSTGLLRGRKLFVWGQNPGGRHWADWLGGDDQAGADADANSGSGSGSGSAYVEVQAGLAATQYENLPMPPGAEWRWVEAYAPLAVDTAVSHGPDHDAAVAHVEERLAAIVPQDRLDSALTAAGLTVDQPPVRIVQAGSGWGRLECARAAADAEAMPDLTGTPFPADDSAECHPWRALLTDGRLPAADPATPPPSYVHGASWQRRLRSAPPGDWLTAYHLGVLAHASGNLSAARESYLRSLGAAPSAWAERGLALVDAAEGRVDSAADRLLAAHALAPAVWQLTVETLTALTAAGRHVEAITLVEHLPAEQRRHSRIRLQEASAALGAGELDRARLILLDGIEIADLREGDETLTSLWEQAFPGEALPYMYDFRMRPG
jgi:Domain of unknown function (DUF5107)